MIIGIPIKTILAHYPFYTFWNMLAVISDLIPKPFNYKNNCETINAMMVADNVKMKKGLFYFIDDNGDVCSTDKEHIYEAWNDWIEQNAVYDKKAEYESQQALEDEKIEKRLFKSKSHLFIVKYLHISTPHFFYFYNK